MKSFFHLLFVFAIALTLNLSSQAADTPPSALETLKTAQSKLGNSGKQLLSMTSEGATLRPRYWWIRFYDPGTALKIRAIQIIGPDIVRDTKPANPFDGGNAEHIIQTDLIKYDSEKCISFMEKQAKANNIPLHSLNVRLEKLYPGESNPLWFFEWFDASGKSLGTITISATTGKIMEIVGIKLRDPKFSPVSKKTISQKGSEAGQNVESTFLGIGGDLEEFFTGERTVDKSEKPAKSD